MNALHGRLFKSSAANALGLLARVGQQLLLVPILLNSWATQLYGEWLLVSAIPLYISLSDFGFIAAGSNELARRASFEDKASVQRFYDRYTGYFQRWSLLLVLVFAAVSYLLPLRRMLGLELMTERQVGAVFFLLTLSALVTQNALSLVAGMRIMGQLHVGLLIRAVAALAQIAITFCLVQFFSAGPVGIAVSILFCAVLSYGVEWKLLSRFGLRQRTHPLRSALESEPMWLYLMLGLEMMLMPLAQALALQGSILIVGKLLGPVAVAVFGTHRTLARLSASLLQLFSNPLRAEAGMLQRPEDRPALTRVVQLLSRITLWLSLTISVVLMAIGAWFFKIWTHGHVLFDPKLFLALLVGVVAESLWRVPTSIRLGTNRHRPVAWGYLGCSIGGLLVAAALASTWGLPGVGIGISLIDIAMGVVAIRTLRGILDDTTRDYIHGLLRPPISEIRQFLGRALAKGI